MTHTKARNQRRIRFCLHLTNVNSWLRFGFVVSVLTFALTTSTERTESVGLTKRAPQVPLLLLESAEGAINQGSPSRAIAVSATDAQVLYTVDRGSEEVVVHETHSKSARRFRSFVSPQNVEALAVGPEGNIYLADSVSGRIQIISASGQSLNVVPVVAPIGLGILGNGNIVTASSAGLKLLHLYGPTGSRLASFGEMRSLDINNPKQNRFLNKGKIAIGASDTIYYISRYAPVPTVRKFSTDGQLLSEFVVSGAAIDYQVNIANDFLRKKQSSVVGGFDVITSATVDPSTGHLWISMNGTSKTGVVYEYDTNGVKLREYAFLLKSPKGYSDIITGTKDIVVKGPWIYVLTWDGLVYRFNSNNWAKIPQQDGKNQILGRLADSRSRSLFCPGSVSTIGFLAALQLPCPTAQPLTCVATCRSGSSPTSQDCGAEVSKRLTSGDTLIGGSCSNSAGPEPSCSASGNFCNTGTGTRGTISVSLTCNEPPPPPPPPPDPEPGGCTPETCPGHCFDGLCTQTPILIDVSGNGFNLTNLNGGVSFDLNADGIAETLSWTSAGSDDAWLALDRDNDGAIENGTELFGEFAPQPDPPAGGSKNGFLALAEYDKPANGGNSDGVIDPRDAIYSSLRLWQDSNHNGVSETTELHTLSALGVVAIELDYKLSKKTDEYGNQFGYRAKIRDIKGAQLGRWAWDVFLVTQ